MLQRKARQTSQSPQSQSFRMCSAFSIERKLLPLFYPLKISVPFSVFESLPHMRPMELMYYLLPIYFPGSGIFQSYFHNMSKTWCPPRVPLRILNISSHISPLFFRCRDWWHGRKQRFQFAHLSCFLPLCHSTFPNQTVGSELS